MKSEGKQTHQKTMSLSLEVHGNGLILKGEETRNHIDDLKSVGASWNRFLKGWVLRHENKSNLMELGLNISDNTDKPQAPREFTPYQFPNRQKFQRNYYNNNSNTRENEFHESPLGAGVTSGVMRGLVKMQQQSLKDFMFWVVESQEEEMKKALKSGEYDSLLEKYWNFVDDTA